MAFPGVALTGPPGIGKSTACVRVAELLGARGLRVEGFLTEELRERGAGRVGFDVVGLGQSQGMRAPLARLGGSGPRVGRYTVSLAEFEGLAVPILDRVLEESRRGIPLVCIVDEIGKMELFSKLFQERMRALLRSVPVPLLLTVALSGTGLIEEAKRAAGFELIELSHSSRDAVPAKVLQLLCDVSEGAPAKALAETGEETGTGARRHRQADDHIFAMRHEQTGSSKGSDRGGKGKGKSKGKRKGNSGDKGKGQHHVGDYTNSWSYYGRTNTWWSHS